MGILYAVVSAFCWGCVVGCLFGGEMVLAVMVGLVAVIYMAVAGLLLDKYKKMG